MKHDQNEAAQMSVQAAGQKRGAYLSDQSIAQKTSDKKPAIEKLLKAADVADVLGISRTAAYRLMGNELPAVRFGGNTVRVRLADLERFIASRVEGGES